MVTFLLRQFEYHLHQSETENYFIFHSQKKRVPKGFFLYGTILCFSKEPVRVLKALWVGSYRPISYRNSKGSSKDSYIFKNLFWEFKSECSIYETKKALVRTFFQSITTTLCIPSTHIKTWQSVPKKFSYFLQVTLTISTIVKGIDYDAIHVSLVNTAKTRLRCCHGEVNKKADQSWN